MFETGYWLFARQVWHLAGGGLRVINDPPEPWEYRAHSASGYDILLRGLPVSDCMEYMLVGDFGDQKVTALIPAGATYPTSILSTSQKGAIRGLQV